MFRSLRTAEPPVFFVRCPLFGCFRVEQAPRKTYLQKNHYRTPCSRHVIPSPRDFSAKNVFLTQLGIPNREFGLGLGLRTTKNDKNTPLYFQKVRRFGVQSGRRDIHVFI